MSESNPASDTPNELNQSGGTRLPRAVWILSFVSLLADISNEIVDLLLPLGLNQYS